MPRGLKNLDPLLYAAEILSALDLQHPFVAAGVVRNLEQKAERERGAKNLCILTAAVEETQTKRTKTGFLFTSAPEGGLRRALMGAQQCSAPAIVEFEREIEFILR